jgi:hypothetical protein
VEATIWLAQCDAAEGLGEQALEGLHYALGRVKALPRDEDKVRPLRFLYEIFDDSGDLDAAADCAGILRRLGEDVPPPDLDHDDDDDDEDEDPYGLSGGGDGY